MAKNGARTRDRQESQNHTKVDAAAQQQQIAERAYAMFCERRCEPGHDVEDWLAAEREIVARNSRR